MRENLRQMALVTARLEGRDLGSAVRRSAAMLDGDARCRSATPTRSAGSTSRSARRSASCCSSRASPRRSCSSSSSIQFRAFTPAALILAAAPLSLGGALGLLLLTGTELNVSSAMGLILLVGLVVKNGIVLLDFAEKRYADGHAARTRRSSRPAASACGRS